MNRSEKINVLFIIKPERTAGAELVLLEAASRLDCHRFRVLCGLLTPDRDQVVPGDLPTVNFRLPRLNGPIWLRFFLHLCWVLYRHHIQVLHVNSYVPGNYARAAAILMGVPIIIDHWHGFTRFSPKRRTICRLLGRFTDLSLAVSPGVRRYLLKQCSLDPDQVRVMPNGVDCAKFQGGRPRAVVRRELGLPPEAPVVGLVARLDHWGKGHGELFTALARLRPRHPLHALIIGGGRRQQDMEQTADELGLSPVVHFLGNRGDIPDLLNALDIFVLPSYSEGVSLALLEAMAAGLPVIASDVGGTPEVVRHGENGLLIPARDADALAHSLARLLNDPAWARQLGDNARRDVQENFSLERLGRAINEIYEELAHQKFGRGGQGPTAA